MIDDKINSSLKEIERELQNISSARNQVDKTVASYEELNSTTSAYVNSLGIIKTELTNLVNTLRVDYKEINDEFKRQQKEIEKASQFALKSVSEAAEGVKKSVEENVNAIQQKLTISLVLNGVLIAIVVALHFIK